MNAKNKLIMFACVLFLSACTGFPKGTPAATKAYSAAADTTAILGKVGTEKLTSRSQDESVAGSTRIEIYVTGRELPKPQLELSFDDVLRNGVLI